MISSDQKLYDFEGTEDDTYEIASYDFMAKKKENDTTSYYCCKDKDYTIKGMSLSCPAPFLVANRDNNTIIDAISGKTLLTVDSISGCTYTAARNGQIYLYARNQDGSTDIYLVQ